MLCSSSVFLNLSLSWQLKGAGYGDFNDGVVRNISELFSVFEDVGGKDRIYTLDGDNVAIGGVGGDEIDGGDDRDIIVSEFIAPSFCCPANLKAQLFIPCFLYAVWRFCKCFISSRIHIPQASAFRELQYRRPGYY